MRKARQIADLMRDHLAVRYGKTYNTTPINPDSISEIGLVGATDDGSPTKEPRPNEPVSRLFAIVGASMSVVELGEGNPYEVITRSMTKLPDQTIGIALWAQCLMRAIPNDLRPEFEAGATPYQPMIAREIDARGLTLNTDQICVISIDGFVTDCYLEHGVMRSEIDDASELGGQMPIALASLFVMSQHTTEIYRRVRDELAISTADQFAEIDDALARLSQLIDDEPDHTPTDSDPTPPQGIARPFNESTGLTAEKLLAEIRTRVAELDSQDKKHLGDLIGDLDEIARAIADDLGITPDDLDEIRRALGLVKDTD
jgi:hypothetical protein